jgi:hypothetical protein
MSRRIEQVEPLLIGRRRHGETTELWRLPAVRHVTARTSCRRAAITQASFARAAFARRTLTCLAGRSRNMPAFTTCGGWSAALTALAGLTTFTTRGTNALD